MAEGFTAKHPIAIWSALIVAVVSAIAASIALWTKQSDQGLKRWSLNAPAAEEPAFTWIAKDWREARVSVYSFRPPPSPAHVPTLLDLADIGQAHAIDFLSKDSNPSPHKWAELQQALSDANAAAASQDPFKFDRILVATVTKGAAWDPGDRMIWTRVFVQPINFKFTGYTVAATENETKTVASVEATNSRKISADLGLTVPGLEGSKADVAPSAEQTLKTTSDVTTQYERLGVDITPGFLRIIRESEAGGDVLGNATLSLSMVTDLATIMKTAPRETPPSAQPTEVLLVTGEHLQEDAVELDDKKASVSVLPHAPPPHCPLKAKVWMLYEQRHIVDGAQFYQESQQTVSLLRKAHDEGIVEIVAADDVAPAVWRIDLQEPDAGACQAAEIPKQKGAEDCATTGFLKAKVIERKGVAIKSVWRDIVFTDYGEASRLAHWLRNEYIDKLGNLHFNYCPGASLVPVKVTGNDCEPAAKTGAAKTTCQAMPPAQ